MGIRERIGECCDAFEAWEGPRGGVTGGDPLGWPAYPDLLAEARAATGSDESVVTGSAEVGGHPVAVVATDFDFVGGSMGLAAGERVVRAYDRARTEGLPVVVLACSGGARLQEGMLALVQLARTADAARRHAEAGLAQVALLDSPVTGGVYASFVSLADVLWAAPGAVLGFAGPRVVEMTTGEQLAPGAHSAASALGAGLVDDVVDVHRARDALATLVGTVARAGNATRVPLAAPPRHARSARAAGRDIAPDAWEEVQRARAPDRPSGRAWLEQLVPTRTRLRGDRAGGVDDVVVAGVGRTVAGRSVAFVALDRHTGTGRPGPAGFRTARRVLALAARLGLPVLTLVDTPGADPSDDAERGGVAGEIARTLAALVAHPAPTVSLVVGEGGSGGALALGACDRCYLLDGAVFEVIAPEGAAAILERDPDRAPEVAGRLGLTGPALVELGLVDGVVAAADTVATVEAALAEAQPGDGRARLDAATERWLHRDDAPQGG